ncbi:MAG: PIN domain-containing protein [Chitinophagales bacterium]|nr:PIN domain-containing protein [Hyphomicrobiales bacterium]
MMLIDTSVLISMFRDQTGRVAERLSALVGDGDLYLTRFTQMELLQGCRDEAEWLRLDSYLEGQTYIEATDLTWAEAARIYFDLRRKGLRVRSVIDCYIAQLALENQMTLIHNDRDFEVIAKLRRYRQTTLDTVRSTDFHENDQDAIL